jgi:signal transduction histidine kinase
MFSNNAISIRLFNGYFIIIIFLGIITIVSLVKLGSINYLKKSLVDNYARIEYISNLEINKEKLITKTRMHNIKKGNEQEVAEDCLNILNSMGNEALQLTSISRNNPLLLRLSNAIKNHCNILSSEYKAHTYPGNRILLPEINNLGVVISAFKKEGYEDMEWLQGSLKSVIKSAFTTLLFFFLITVIYSIFLSINIASSITKPLSKLMDAAKIIRGGNLSHRVFTVQDDERKRLSQVLHEEIGQSMSALKINFKLLEHYNNNNNNKSKAVSGNNDEFQSCVEDCRKIVDMAFKSLRSLTFSLKYNILDKMGILEATNYYLEQVSERSAIRIITASNVKEEDVSEHIKMHLFRIICEAITNIIKHANATLIRLDFAQDGNNFVLCISDNGSGFNVKNVLGKSEDAFKMGLTTLRELVHIMRGKLNIISELSKGTSLIIKLPLNKNKIKISGGV